jgi:glutamate-ammonia-ligase adenylyltransferase
MRKPMTHVAAAGQQALAEDPSMAGSLAVRIVEAPFRADPAQSLAKLDGWLTELGAATEVTALRQALAAAPKAQALIAGLLEFSPYLSDLVCANPARLLRLLGASPERHLQALPGCRSGGYCRAGWQRGCDP